MKKNMRIIASVAAVLLCSAAPSLALDVGVGSGGVSVSGSNGGGAGASNGSSGTSATVSGAGTSTTVGTTNNSGDLVSASNNGGDTSGQINLGGAGLDGLGLGGAGDGTDIGGLLPGTSGDGNVNADAVGTAYAQLSGGEQAELQKKCKGVLASPKRFSDNLVSLCRVIEMLK